MAHTAPAALHYPTEARSRDGFVVAHRPAVARPDGAWHPPRLIIEDERTKSGDSAPVATAFLTTRECPWRCTMCDLWQQTIETPTPAGAVPAQLADVRARLREAHPPVTRLKLYNAGSFFDERAIPSSDYDAVADLLRDFDHVVVESHPALIGVRVDRLQNALARTAGQRHAVTGRRPALEVAMGLETAHPAALAALNKRMTVDSFAAAAAALAERRIDLRVFLLIGVPFVEPREQDAWLLRSVDTAFAMGASVVSLVPTRGGEGTLKVLADDGAFVEPTLGEIERSARLAVGLFARHGRIFVDLWDLPRFSRCPVCLDRRIANLRAMNHTQQLTERSICEACGG